MFDAITKETKISIGLVIAILCFLTTVGYVLWNEIREIRTDVSEIRATQSDRWTLTHMTLFVEQMREDNPELDVPTVVETVRLYNEMVRNQAKY